MRAKVSVVVLVVFGLLGAAGLTASAAERPQAAKDRFVVMDRDGHYDHDHHKGAKKGKGKGKAPECVAFEVLVGPVCVEIGDILSAS